MTTYNYLEQLYLRELETLRFDPSNRGRLTSDVDEDIDKAKTYGLGDDALYSIETWDILTERYGRQSTEAEKSSRED